MLLPEYIYISTPCNECVCGIHGSSRRILSTKLLGNFSLNPTPDSINFAMYHCFVLIEDDLMKLKRLTVKQLEPVDNELQLFLARDSWGRNRLIFFLVLNDDSSFRKLLNAHQFMTHVTQFSPANHETNRFAPAAAAAIIAIFVNYSILSLLVHASPSLTVRTRPRTP